MILALLVAAQLQTPGSAGPPPKYEAFSLDLFRRVTQHTAADSNVFLSPASAAFALAMAHRGAGGTTQAAIAQTLGVASDESDALQDSLSRQSDVQLMVARSIWAERGLPFLDSFLRQAPARTVELQSPEAQQQINAWVAEATKGKIPTMISGPLPDSAVMVLLNAVYFKGLWRDKFDAAETRPHPFLVAGGTAVTRRLMFRHATMQYQRGPNFQAVRLPYRGNRMAMYVLLPDSGLSITQFAATLDTAHWDRWMRHFGDTRIRLGLPTFRVEYETTLNEPLTALGMGVAFDEKRADFSGMLPRSYLARKNVFISKVMQKTYVDVDEQGTEAAATTEVVGAEPTALVRPIEMIVDRPFIAAIRDDKTGLLLFLGQINDPRQR